ncbi:glycosyl hydrolase family 88 [Lachnospiraceae bacterium]|nr:glycosyl hydrolase family 88 [Lachnospiraceae bacterium]GKH41839.1 glycosyl hydrolase family 88 [Lachnospiraceae bacterium]GKH54456.1 glycosyl hydrolase family 88 [Lachnospiraceae bacterium]
MYSIDKEWLNEVIEKIQKKMDWVSDKNHTKVPYTTDENGNYDDRSDESIDWTIDNGINFWTNGFWGGIQWLLYQNTGDEKYRIYAKECEKKLEKCFDMYYGLHHDVGFMYMPTAVANYRLTQDAEARKIAMHAANLLAGRFNPVGKFIRAWNLESKDTRGWAIIDCMFNLSLLYWASEETKDPRFKQIAMMHADTVIKNFVREDGSVNHIVEFNPETGEKVCSYGGQGYEDGSSWTRGQGWGLYGFMISYRHTGKKEYLDTAKRIAHYCIANIPESGFIPVDFRQPKTPAYEDSCGACVIAGGLLELAKEVPDVEKEVYIRPAVKILKAIAEHRSNWDTDCDAIVQNCSGSYHAEKHHITMNYADYYFIESILKLNGEGIFMW